VTPEIIVIGIDPGGTTGWCRITVPTLSIFGKWPSEIIEWDYGALNGPEAKQAQEIARYAREQQGLCYGVGPAIVTEAWDQDPSFKSTDSQALSPCRINAMLELLDYMDMLGDSTLTQQPRTMAMTTMTDERLHKRRMYVAHKDIRAATRHAITALRRAHTNPDFRAKLWPYAAAHWEDLLVAYS
jgi:hypothetical protein